jgi:hypothetical protein
MLGANPALSAAGSMIEFDNKSMPDLDTSVNRTISLTA